MQGKSLLFFSTALREEEHEKDPPTTVAASLAVKGSGEQEETWPAEKQPGRRNPLDPKSIQRDRRRNMSASDANMMKISDRVRFFLATDQTKLRNPSVSFQIYAEI